MMEKIASCLSPNPAVLLCYQTLPLLLTCQGLALVTPWKFLFSQCKAQGHAIGAAEVLITDREADSGRGGGRRYPRVGPSIVAFSSLLVYILVNLSKRTPPLQPIAHPPASKCRLPLDITVTLLVRGTIWFSYPGLVLGGGEKTKQGVSE